MPVITSTPVANAAPIGPAGGALAGTYPNPALAYAATPIILSVDTASLDTGAGGIDTTGNVLEIRVYARTDEAGAAGSQCNFTFNGDSGANYDRNLVSLVNATVTGAVSIGANFYSVFVAGGLAAANVFSTLTLTIPGYASAIGNKTAIGAYSVPDQTAANMRLVTFEWAYRSTTPISRVTLVPNTGGVKFKAGSMMLIYAH